MSHISLHSLHHHLPFSRSDHSSPKNPSDLYKVIYDPDEPIKKVTMRVGDKEIVLEIERVYEFGYNPLIFRDIKGSSRFTGASAPKPLYSTIFSKVTEPAPGLLYYSVKKLAQRPSKSLIRHIKDSLPTYLVSGSELPHRDEDKNKQAFIIYREACRIAEKIFANRKTILPPVIDTSQNPYEYFETPLASYPKLHTASLFKHLIPKMLSGIFSSRNWREEIFIGPMIRLSDLVDSDASLQFIQEYASSNERAFFNSYKCLSVLDAIDLLEKLLPIAQSECLYTDDGSYLWRAADEISAALKALKKYPIRVAPIRPLPQVGQPLSP